ncbi:hypothetical protein BGLA2_1110064 [Burkholderia gladioli]|nr:hypothetical protein BGLA2_1110064 [Burkholderia gladioli]
MRTRFSITASRLDEGEQVGVEHIGINRQHAVREAGVGFQRAVLQQLDGLQRGVGDRHDLVVLAVQHQGRHRNRLQVLGLVGFREGLDALVMRLRAADHALAPPVLDHALMNRRARAIEAIERAARHVEEELRAVVGQRLTEAVEHLDGQAFGVGIGLLHERGHRADQYRLRDAPGRLAMLGDIAGDFTAAGRVADVDGVLQVERLDHGEGVGRVMVHVVSVRYLRRAAMPATIVGDHAIALLHEEQQLRVPVVRGQGPAMMEDDGLRVLGAPVFVENLDLIFGGDEWHGNPHSEKDLEQAPGRAGLGAGWVVLRVERGDGAWLGCVRVGVGHGARGTASRVLRWPANQVPAQQKPACPLTVSRLCPSSPG